MSRNRTFTISGINIRVHSEHSPQEYVRMWRKLYSLGGISVYGHLGAMIGDLHREVQDNRWMTGYFYTFVDIDPSQRWLNVTERTEADDDEVEDIRIPDHLRPNMQSIPYVFDLRDHKLYFIVHEKDCGISTGRVKKLLRELVSHYAITDRFGVVDLTILTDRSQVDELLAWPVIRRLHLTLERINPTDYQDEQEVFERLAQIGAEREERTYVKDGEEGTLRPDETLRRIAHIAADNGEVEVVGRKRDGTPGKEKSQNFPMVSRAEYNPNRTTLVDAFLGHIRDVLSLRR